MGVRGELSPLKASRSAWSGSALAENLCGAGLLKPDCRWMLMQIANCSILQYLQYRTTWKTSLEAADGREASDKGKGSGQVRELGGSVGRTVIDEPTGQALGAGPH